MKFNYTDRYFLTLVLQTYLDIYDVKFEEREIIRRILKKILKEGQEIELSGKDKDVIIFALDEYPVIGRCNKLILSAVEELKSKLAG